MKKSTLLRKMTVVLLLVGLAFNLNLTPTPADGRLALAAEESSLYVTGYQVLRGGSPTTSVNRNNTVTIIVSLKNNKLTAAEIGGAEGLSIAKLVDSFRNGDKPVAAITSEPDAPLEFTLTFANLVYNGSDRNLKFLLDYANLETITENKTIRIVECNEYVPSTADDDDSPSSFSGPAPLLRISRSELKAAIEPNQKFKLDVKLENMTTSYRIENIAATVSTSDGLMLLGSSSTQILTKLNKNEGSFQIELQALDEITSPSQFVTVDLKYDYVSGKNRMQGTSSEKLLIPAATKSSKGSVYIQVASSELPVIKPNQHFGVTLTLSNPTDTKITNVIAALTPSDGLMLLDKTASKYIDAIEPHSSRTVTVSLKALNEISSAAQSLGLDLKYDYTVGGSMTQGTSTEKITIPAATQGGGVDAATPNVIVSKYTYGEAVEAGQTFDLNLFFKNTSTTLPVENIVMSLELGEGLAISASSNTYFYSALGATGVKSQSIPIQALATAKPENATIDISFKYEYVDGGKRNQVTTNEKITLPVYQPDRFIISPPTLPEQIFQFEEMNLSLSYNNKGKSDVSNVEAELVGDVEALSTYLTLGNFEPGKSGTIDFIITPTMLGEQTVTVLIKYEDANLQPQTMEFPITLYVEEAPMMEMPEDFPIEEESSGVSKLWLLLIPAAAVIAYLILRRRRKHKQQAATEIREFDWDEDDLEAEPLGSPMNAAGEPYAEHQGDSDETK